MQASAAWLCGSWCPVQCLVLARGARRSKVLDVVSAAILGDAVAENAVPHWARKGHGLCKSEFNDEFAITKVARLLRSM